MKESRKRREYVTMVKVNNCVSRSEKGIELLKAGLSIGKTQVNLSISVLTAINFISDN